MHAAIRRATTARAARQEGHVRWRWIRAAGAGSLILRTRKPPRSPYQQVACRNELDGVSAPVGYGSVHGGTERAPSAE